jgi:hypothetical protein
MIYIITFACGFISGVVLMALMFMAGDERNGTE